MTLTKEDWLLVGLTHGWISEPTCIIHNTIPVTEEEDQIFTSGDSVCLYGMRLWD